MAKITVYRYRIYDEFSKSYITSKSLATRRAIDAIEAEIIPDTAEEVDLGSVNTDGIVVLRRPDPESGAAPAAPDAKAADPEVPEPGGTAKDTAKPL